MIPRMIELELLLKIFGAAGLLLLVFVAIYAWTQRKVGVRFWCDAKKRFVSVRFIASPFHKRYVDVESCSAFREGEKIDCGKPCVDLDKRKIEAT